MWSLLVFVLAVGVGLGSNAPAWKTNLEYIYQIQGRALASLDTTDKFSGILTEASLKLQARPDGRLQGLILTPQYAQIFSQLSGGWMAHIPEQQVNWKPLRLSRQPFQIELNNGLITDLIFNKGTPNWEVNMVKGMISQFQLNIYQGDLQKGNQNSAKFQVYEETVTGHTDTMYEVSPLPEFKTFDESIPEFQRVDGDQDLILEVLKHKNFSEHSELPSYVFGFGSLPGARAATNTMGKFFIRNSMSRTLVTGSLQKFTIQHSLALNEILASPTLGDKQKAAVYTMWKTTLLKVKPQGQIFDEIPAPIRVGLVYSYDKPYAKSNEIQAKIKNLCKQMQTPLGSAVDTPFLPFSVGYEGRAAKLKLNGVNSAIKLIEQIAKDTQTPSKIPEKNTHGKFIMLISLLRTFDEAELKQVSKELLLSDITSWNIFRDAAAETGYGPALLLIQSWIETHTINGTEAAHVVASMAKSAQLPTTAYIKTFWKLVTNSAVTDQWPLNETAIFAFTELTRKIYFEKQLSFFETHYPINAFEQIRDKEGLKLIRETVIPHFSQQLDKAVGTANTNNIHVFIRALGDIGEPEILKSFEDYLEGKKHCSQYQRTLMVVSMAKLVKSYPKLMTDVLIRIIENTGETSATRVAAVFQFMRTGPSIEMLQHLASSTQTERDEYVNAAIHTSIESISTLNLPEFMELRKSAQLAKPLLKNKQYGIQLGGNFLRSYILENLGIEYEDILQFSNTEQLIPNDLRYSLTANIGGLKTHIWNIQYLVSSIDNLINVFKEQTEEFQNEKRQQREQAEQQGRYPYSSLNVAKILDMKKDVQEQLEGNVFLMDLVSPIRILSIDNRTIEQLPEILKSLERKLRNKQTINYLKFANTDHMVLAVPNEMGLPVIFSYNAPVFVKAEGTLKATSKPELSQNGKIQTPHTLQAHINISLTVGAKIEGHLSFVTPFEARQYISGFDKNLQFQLPVDTKVNIDLEKNEIEIEAKTETAQNENTLLHYSTWPFIGKKEILDQRHNTIIKGEGVRTYQRTLGKEYLGLAFNIDMKHKRNTIKMSDYRFFCEYGIINGLKHLWDDSNIQYSYLNVSYLPRESSTQKIVLKLRYKQRYTQNIPKQPINWLKIAKSTKSLERLEIIANTTASGLKNAASTAIDASLKLKGKPNIEYVISGASSSSELDAKSRTYAYYKMEMEDKQPFQMTFEKNDDVPKVAVMDLQEALKTTPNAKTNMELTYGLGSEMSKIKATVQFSRSEQRKSYIKDKYLYQECIRDERKGNKQSPACFNLTLEANLLNRISADIHYQNIDDSIQNVLEIAYDHLRYKYYPNLEMSTEGLTINDRINVKAEFHQDLRFVNVTVNTEKQSTIFTDIEVNEIVKKAMVVHPTINLQKRVWSYILGIQEYAHECVVDHTQVTTLSNVTYKVNLTENWTVLAEYVPLVSDETQQVISVAQQLRSEPDNFILFIRKTRTSIDERELKIMISGEQTKFSTIDIVMSPSIQSWSPGVAITVNGRPANEYDNGNGFVQIHRLPHGEAQVDVRNRFVLIFDGKRAKFIPTTEGVRKKLIGICGAYNDQPLDDFLTPQNCISRSTDKFIKSYEVNSPDGKQVRQDFQKNSSECLYKSIPSYVNVIKRSDINIFGEDEDPQGNQCLWYQTKYEQINNEICFTIRAVPTCKKHCQTMGYFLKSVPAHCASLSNAAKLWKTQIDDGLNPDFSHKPETRKIDLKFPQLCSK
uniref:Vitellogenin 1 n=1 Tax=Agasicles hygrophila TaxID=715812 RepID=A0A516KLL5_9CUCU|nr:Vitellogenin 1 [Agasicles hygrophila]